MYVSVSWYAQLKVLDRHLRKCWNVPRYSSFRVMGSAWSQAAYSIVGMLLFFKRILYIKHTCVYPAIATVAADHGTIRLVVVIHFETHRAEVTLMIITAR